MNPAKTIQINQGAINYTFTIYQQTDVWLPDTDKLEDIMLAVLIELRHHYHEIDFRVEYFYENLSRQWRLFFQIRNTRYSTQRIAVGTWINHVQYLEANTFELSICIVNDVLRKMRAFIGTQRWRIMHERNCSRIIVGNNDRIISFDAEEVIFEQNTINCGSYADAMNCREVVKARACEYLSADFHVNVKAQIKARLPMSRCTTNNINDFAVNELILETRCLDYRYIGNSTIEVIVTPNININTVAFDSGDAIFETLPFNTVIEARTDNRYEVFGIETSAFVGNSIMGTATERMLRRRESKAIMRRANEEASRNFVPPFETESDYGWCGFDLAREAVNTGYLKNSGAINNKSCKYFNGGAYLKCAVNPSGACDGCKDYEPN